MTNAEKLIILAKYCSYKDSRMDVAIKKLFSLENKLYWITHPNPTIRMIYEEMQNV